MHTYYLVFYPLLYDSIRTVLVYLHSYLYVFVTQPCLNIFRVCASFGKIGCVGMPLWYN